MYPLVQAVRSMTPSRRPPWTARPCCFSSRCAAWCRDIRAPTEHPQDPLWPGAQLHLTPDLDAAGDQAGKRSGPGGPSGVAVVARHLAPDSAADVLQRYTTDQDETLRRLATKVLTRLTDPGAG
jgi:hypothetical protein